MDTLQDIWNAVGGLLVVILVFEAVPNLWKRLSRRVRHGPAGKPDYRALADAYNGADWPVPYFVDIWNARIDWAPHVGGKLRPFSSTHFNIGDGGRRRTWNARSDNREEGALKIFAFGGSTMLGIGARDEWTVPSLLAKKLTEAGWRVEVVNFGQPGYTASQSFIGFTEELTRGNVPTMAIFLDGLNEVIPAEQSGQAGMVFNSDKRSDEFNLLQPWRRGDLLRHALQAVLVRTMRRYRVLEELLNTRAKPPSRSNMLSPEKIEPLSREVVAHYINTLKFIRAIADANGVATLFFWQPSLFTKRHLSNHEARYQNDGAPVPELRAPLFRTIYETLKSDSDFRSMPGAVDISGLFDESPEPYFIDPFHLVEKGTDVVADAMLPHVVQILKERTG